MHSSRFLVTFCNNRDKSDINFAEVRISYSDRTLENVEVEGFSLYQNNLAGTTGIIVNNDHILIGMQGSNKDLAYIDTNYKILELRTMERMFDIHGIAMDEIGVIGVSTGSNCIARENGDLYSLRSSFDPLEVDIEHINDVCWSNNKLIACKFGSKRINGLRNGSVYEVASGNVLLDGLNQPHSVYCYADQLYVLDSLTGTLLQLNADYGPKVVASIKGYARGLCMTDRVLLIGSSRRRTFSRRSGQRASVTLFADEEQKLAYDLPGIHIFDKLVGNSVFVNLDDFSDEIYQISELY